jgi:acetyl esterase/lipase
MHYASGITAFIERANAVLPPDFHRAPIWQQRQLYNNLNHAFPFERAPGIQIWDTDVQHNGQCIPIRVYRPETAQSAGGALLYMHGGGFVLGSLETHDTIVAELAAKSGQTLIAVDFRPAPEHPFPAAIEDCYAALCGVVADASRFDIDGGRIGVAGDSSGANLAVATCLQARDRGGPTICAQILVSPVLDFARWRSGGTDAPLLSSDEMVFFTTCYVGDSAYIDHPYVSPLRNAQFHGLPPAYILAAECDSLCIDAHGYAELLRQQGIPVQLVVEPGFVHACLRARGCSPAVADAFDRLCAATRALVADSEPAWAIRG